MARSWRQGSTLRIVAGKYRGRPIAAPPGADIRPTSDRARESLFNILEHGRIAADLGVEIKGAHILDAFAGTGALGLEALSRGAKHVTFIENARAARKCLLENLKSCDEQENATILDRDATSPPPTKQPVGIAFLDPPYRADLLEPSLVALNQRGWFSDTTLILAELASGDTFEAPDFLAEHDRRKYGAAQIVFLSRRRASQ